MSDGAGSTDTAAHAPGGDRGAPVEVLAGPGGAARERGAALPPGVGARDLRGPHSIAEFLTDGSLARLCAELSALTGTEIQLRDGTGRLVVPSSGARPWEFREAGVASGTVFPMKIGEEVIGALVLGPGGAEPRGPLERTLELLASTAAELCDSQLEMRHRVKEVGALYRLNALLVRATNIERVMEVALESALDVLEMDAGSLVLLREDAEGFVGQNEDDLTLMASRNLSRHWLEYPEALSKGRVFDQLALKGEVVTSEDLREDPRVQTPDQVREEGLVAFINAGLVFQGRPIGVLRLYAREKRAFSDSERRLLRSVAQQAAVAVQQTRLLKHREEEKRIQRQVQLGADVQRRMLPRAMPNVAGLDIAAKYLPSFELGGDFYDFLELGPSLGIVIGDVVGKGIAAALFMAAVRASLRAHTEGVYDLDVVISRVNQALCRDTLDQEFATLWYGVVDPGAQRLTYCSAGHEPTMVVRMPKGRAPAAADLSELAVGGMVVGVDRTQKYQRAIFDLKARDVLIAYTDGVTDAVNYAGEKWGKKRLREAVLRAVGAHPEGTASEILEQIFWELRQFAGLAGKPDDQTMVVVKVAGGGAKK